jgi:hypothetical protein
MKADWDGHPGAETWTGFVAKGLDSSALTTIVPADVATFWPNYGGADDQGRRQFWTMLISAIAKEESGFDPNCVYHEPLPLNVDSLGLMQLSLGDNHYGCNFTDEASVKDPELNLLCAVRILDRLVRRDGRIGGDAQHHAAGAAAYWSTLRTPKPGKRDARAYIIARTRTL